MAQETAKLRKSSNAYQIFILVLTVLSLLVMAVMLLPSLSDATYKVLGIYDNLICVIFLIDFPLTCAGHPRNPITFSDSGAGSICSARSTRSGCSNWAASCVWPG